MVKMSSFPVGSGTSAHDLTIKPAGAAEPANGETKKMEFDRAHANRSKKHASTLRRAHAHDMPLTRTANGLLGISEIEAVTSVSPSESFQISEIDPRAAAAALHGHTLARSQLSFIMPRIRHPEILREGKRSVLLERLVKALAAVPEDSVAREGIAALQEEFRRLVLLRLNRNSLIKASEGRPG
ncbi:hypothetical protein LCM4577_16250 [Mesorhizobium sp. LCM 4577]|uniref:hypothetical protein n=1 Tax=Mesorhizobium sp. LCM 4577 TaxID=1848288 RepID=UPI0008D9276D|nr:hypothetical protein [Mesorhizobium sp. LCM 4577]OHV60300.1 hypothetical protein LCM4577_16250 [Mesorhizobium sp. LCM 4577]